MRPARARGFTVVELMIVIAVLALALFFAVPSFTVFLQNQQVRAAGDAILNGLQVARAEAIRRNLSVQIAINVPQTGWTVSESASGTPIQSRTHEEGSANAIVATVPGGTTTVTFTPLGGIVSPNADGSIAVQQIDVSHQSGAPCQAVGNPVGIRCLRVLVTGGGSVRMCDPAVDSAAMPPDPRACP